MFAFFTLTVSELPAGSLQGNFQYSPKSEKKLKIAAYPMAFYTNQTGFAGGAAMKMILGNSLSRWSTIGLAGYYAQNGQYHFGVRPEIYLQDETYKLSGKVDFANYANTFYGIGNDVGNEGIEDYSLQKFGFNFTFQRNFLSHLYIGPMFQFERLELGDLEEGTVFQNGAITGSEGGTVSGLGVLATWDSRDDNIYPRSGGYYQFSTSHYGPYFGSDYTFSSFSLDVCQFVPVFSNHVLAFRGVFGAMTGDPPFQALHSISDTLRGYSKGRFLDRNVVTLQAEYRLPLFWRVGLAAFAGVGQVADSPGNFTLDGFKPAYGAGLRFNLLKEQQMNVRIDYARGLDDSTFDIKFMEAF
jgi:outer membrane protein assembly factor BamA